jgi:hypothetical protein
VQYGSRTGPAQLSARLPQPGQFILQFQGQPVTPYIIQNSPDLFTWTPVSTNLLAGNVLTRIPKLKPLIFAHHR